MRRIVISTLAVLVMLILSACGGGQANLQPVEQTMIMTEYEYNPSTLDFQVGQQVTLHFRNDGQLVHEIMFGRDVMMMDNRPSGYQVDMFQTAGVEPEVTQQDTVDEPEEEEHTGFMIVLPPGGEATIVFPVNQEMVGQWEYGCFEQEGVHYDAGMKGTLTIGQ